MTALATRRRFIVLTNIIFVFAAVVLPIGVVLIYNRYLGDVLWRHESDMVGLVWTESRGFLHTCLRPSAGR